MKAHIIREVKGFCIGILLGAVVIGLFIAALLRLE